MKEYSALFRLESLGRLSMFDTLIQGLLQGLRSPITLTRFCQLAMTLVGSALSPVWGYFNSIMSPWLDIQALQSSSQLIPEVLGFYQKAHLAPELVRTTLLPQLLLCFAMSVLILWLSQYIGLRLAEILLKTQTVRRLIVS